MSRPAALAVLLDLDGTLLDTLADLAASMNAALAERGHPPHPVEAYRLFVGDGVEALVARALPEAARDGETLAATAAAMRLEYARRWADATRPYDGVPELLDGLAARNLPAAILSNKPDDFTVAMVSRLLGRWRFAVVRGERPGIPRKPDPRAALEIARELGVPPGRFVCLGDSAVDILSASAAGMIPVGALWGFRSEAELRGAGADLLVAHPRELLPILDGDVPPSCTVAEPTACPRR
jgi:phosphoglycolate phosphatase